MALKAIIETIEGLPADVAKEYKKNEDGRYHLDVTAVDGLELAEVGKLRSALSKERENNREASDKLKEFEGIDPTKARDAIKKVGEMSNWTPDQKVKEQMDAVKTQLLDAHGKEKAKLEERLAKLTKQLENAMIDSVATQAIVENKGSVKLLMPHVRGQTRLREIDGKFIVEVIGPDNNPRLSGTQATPMTINELVAEMKTQNDFASAFEGTNASGSGSSGGGSGGGGTNAKTLEELAKLPPAERLKRARELGIKK
jgi:hypothetical protein